jgi:organic hydroperoxide reductase OsmC/OhrA
MTVDHISKAMLRLREILVRRPSAGTYADAPALSRWTEGLRVVTRHADGLEITTDMPVEIGGSGDQVAPGWLLRAGLASCLATRIAMEAAAAGVSLTELAVLASSTSDVRGLLGMQDGAGVPVTAAPCEVRLEVKARASNATGERLETLIRDSVRCSPVSAALARAIPVALEVRIEPG